jgi:acetyl esterase/lipase
MSVVFCWDFGRRYLVIAVAALLLCFTSGCLFPAHTEKTKRNVVYTCVKEKEMTLDIFFPRTTNSAPRPVAVNVHGGAWSRGAKWNGTGLIAMSELLKRGYVFVSINYRLAPWSKFPAQIEDAKCAIRFLRAHAKEYNLDPNCFAALGGSAGGHIVGLLGTADASAGFDSYGGWTNESSRIEAVVDMFGPSDLVYGMAHGGGSMFLARTVFGAKSKEDDVFRRASPVTYVTSNSPPFFLLHGEHDSLVPVSQSERMRDALQKVGVPVEFLIVKHAGHSFFPAWGFPKPSRKEIGVLIADFLDRTFKRNDLKITNAGSPGGWRQIP